MGQDPDTIRKEIEQTREQMGNTVDALGYKADVKGRARDSIEDKGRQAVSVAQENPLGLALGAVAVGFVAGMLIPSTRVEDERIGDYADQVKGQIKETASEAVEHGKQVAQEAAQSAQETVKESGSEHAEELASSARTS